MEILSYGLTFSGRRSSNEDYILTIEIDPKRGIYLFAVADGMGGAEGGEIASLNAIISLEKTVKNYFDMSSDHMNLKEIITQSYRNVDLELNKIKNNQPELSGMGTTLCCLLLVENKYVIGNIGDSRVYSYNNKNILQITKDHSAIQEYRESKGNDIDPSILKQYGHIVTKIMDGNTGDPDIFPEDRQYYTINNPTGFLLCSDGLIIDKSELNPEVLYNYCISKLKPKQCVESLIGDAYHNGSTDNISAIKVEIGNIKKKSKKISTFQYPPVEKNYKINPTGNSFKYFSFGISAFLFFIIGIFNQEIYESISSLVKGSPEVGEEISSFNALETKSVIEEEIEVTVITTTSHIPYPIKETIKWNVQNESNISLSYNVYFSKTNDDANSIKYKFNKPEFNGEELRSNKQFRFNEKYNWKVEIIKKESGKTLATSQWKEITINGE